MRKLTLIGFTFSDEFVYVFARVQKRHVIVVWFRGALAAKRVRDDREFVRQRRRVRGTLVARSLR